MYIIDVRRNELQVWELFSFRTDTFDRSNELILEKKNSFET